MSLELANTDFKAMHRRWIYMAVAIIAAALMPLKPVFSFQDDRGIIFVRSFSMTETQLVVTQTELETGISHVKNTMSVRGLFYCYLAMLAGSVLTLLCFFNDEWRVWICTFTALVAGLYYVLMAHYAIVISDEYYATLYPNYMAFLPAIVLQMMVLVRRSCIKEMQDTAEEE